jgi:hypothetical protein
MLHFEIYSLIVFNILYAIVHIYHNIKDIHSCINELALPIVYVIVFYCP